MRRQHTVVAALIVSGLLAGCGGGEEPTVLTTRQDTSEIVISLRGDRLLWAAPLTNQLAEIGEVAKAGGDVRVLTTSTSQPVDIAVDDAFVYWVTSSPPAVLRVARGGGTAETLVTLSAGWATYPPRAVAVDDTNLYWIGADVVSANKDASTAVTLMSWNGIPEGIAVDATHVTWTAFSQVIRLANTGGTSTQLATVVDLRISGLAIDATDAYYGVRDPLDRTGGSIRKASLAGGGETILVDGLDSPTEIAVDATHVYWTDPSAATIAKVVKEGGAAAVLASNQQDAFDIAVDDEYVYWTNGRAILRLRTAP